MATAVAANLRHGFRKGGSGEVPRLRSKIEFIQAAPYGSIEARRDAGTAFSEFASIKISRLLDERYFALRFILVFVQTPI
jgi:hypothetical protein